MPLSPDSSTQMYIIANHKKQVPTDLTFASDIREVARKAKSSVVVCPTVLDTSSYGAFYRGSYAAVGGQNCGVDDKIGADTGEISAQMLKARGADFVILGHSERRQGGEADHLVTGKVTNAIKAGLKAIICVGETMDTREKGDGEAINFVISQLAASLPADVNPADVIIAYEPVWAIGKGKVASPEQVDVMHTAIYESLKARNAAFAANTPPIIYGGSVKPENAVELLSLKHVSGALVGGASLKSKDFTGIIEAGDKALEAKRALAAGPAAA